MTISRTDVICASQVALLGFVTSNLRALTVSILPQELMLNFYYENKPTEEEIKLSQVVSKKVASGFNNILVKEQQILLPQPQPVPVKKKDQWIYQRFEGNPRPFKIQTLFKDITLKSVRCALQFALLGSVTPNLRAVSIGFIEKDLTINFYYDKKRQNNSQDPYEEHLPPRTYFNTVSSFDGATGKVNCFVIPEPEKIPLQGDSIWVYIRYEKTPSDS